MWARKFKAPKRILHRDAGLNLHMVPGSRDYRQRGARSICTPSTTEEFSSGQQQFHCKFSLRGALSEHKGSRIQFLVVQWSLQVTLFSWCSLTQTYAGSPSLLTRH
ncbi:hypothetical protein GN956_G23978 [Arapaima gigas]